MLFWCFTVSRKAYLSSESNFILMFSPCNHSSGSKEFRSALESRRVPLGAHWVDSSLLRRLERGREIGLQAMQETKALISRWRGNLAGRQAAYQDILVDDDLDLPFHVEPYLHLHEKNQVVFSNSPLSQSCGFDPNPHFVNSEAWCYFGVLQSPEKRIYLLNLILF